MHVTFQSLSVQNKVHSLVLETQHELWLIYDMIRFLCPLKMPFAARWLFISQKELEQVMPPGGTSPTVPGVSVD